MASPHSFSLRQLQYLVAVADQLSFRKAAEVCHVSQPSLSAQLAELESAFGVRVFERDRRRVLLTTAGQELVERARKLLAEADDLVEAARRVRDPLSGMLRIGVIPTVSPYLLPAIAPALGRDFPRLKVVWVEDKTASLSEALNRGTLDAAILALEADIGRLEHAVLAKDPFVLATPKNHALGLKKSTVNAEELKGEGILLLDDGHCFREQALAVCADAHARELQFRATSLTTLAQMVASGAGITLLPSLAVPSESKRLGLKVRKFAKPEPHRTIALVWRKGSPLSEALQTVASSMRRRFPVG
jgi:LysR family hydrogen peroxide-inducible transcriptional activator